MHKRKFPYDDEPPLAVANTPEVREYMAIGVVKDEETGQPSEIKEVVSVGLRCPPQLHPTHPARVSNVN